jgi:hypothetical protein
MVICTINGRKLVPKIAIHVRLLNHQLQVVDSSSGSARRLVYGDIALPMVVHSFLKIVIHVRLLVKPPVTSIPLLFGVCETNLKVKQERWYHLCHLKHRNVTTNTCASSSTKLKHMPIHVGTVVSEPYFGHKLISDRSKDVFVTVKHPRIDARQ